MIEFMVIIIGITFAIGFILSGPTAIICIGLKVFNVITCDWATTLIPLYISIFCGISLYIIYLYHLLD